jgi:rhodanese-related sulfurtransferase
MRGHVFNADEVDVSPEQVARARENGELQLVDVREDVERDAGRIAGRDRPGRGHGPCAPNGGQEPLPGGT